MLQPPTPLISPIPQHHSLQLPNKVLEKFRFPNKKVYTAHKIPSSLPLQRATNLPTLQFFCVEIKKRTRKKITKGVSDLHLSFQKGKSELTLLLK
jgi:hypothetical protein